MKKLFILILFSVPYLLYACKTPVYSVNKTDFTDNASVVTTQDSAKTFNVKSYGAKGDGTTDDTHSIQNAIDDGVKNKGNVYLPSGTYLVKSLMIRNGLKRFVCDGTIKGMGKSGVGVITLNGPYIFKGTAVDGCYIKANIDMSNSDIFAIHADGCTNCIFDGNYIFGFTNSDSQKYGILLEKNSNNNKIINNKIIGFEKPTKNAVCIGLFGASEPYGGFFNNGNVTPPKEPCVNNLIEHNDITYGRYAIDMLACQGSIVTNNHCLKQHHRAIYLANSTNHCTVSNNDCEGFGSSGIVVGYGSNNNTIANNIFKQIMNYDLPGAEAAVNVNTGAYENKILKNEIVSFTNYGIYFALNSIRNVADGNTVSGYYLSGIALESEWAKNRPAGAKFSRPNFAPPSIGTKWASKDSEGNVIQNNVIGDPYPGRDAVSAIYVSQLGNEYKNKDNIIQNNIVKRSQNGEKSVYLFQGADGFLDQSGLKNNKTDGGNMIKMQVAKGN